MRSKQVLPVFWSFADFEEVLPIATPLNRLVSMARVGRFPMFVRPSGRKSAPLWRRDEVLSWIVRTYSNIVPEMVTAILEEHGGDLRSRKRGGRDAA